MYRSAFKRFLILSLVSFCVIGFAAAELKAESLWREAEEESAGQSIFSETKGHKIGDIITILIIENSTAVQKATTQNKNLPR